jgi:hypothetical protein
MSLINSENLKKNTIQVYNLLKVLNKNKPLENLNSINEVYDNQADMIEEIIYYNKFKGNKNFKKDESIINSTDFEFEENNDNDDEDFDASQYVNNMKKHII